MLQKLKGHSLETEALFRAEAMGLNLGERDTSATLTLGPDATDIGPGDWVQDLENPGKGIVYRARSVDRQLNTKTRTVNLEHAIRLLADTIIPGEVTGSTMGGTDAYVSAKTAFTYVLGLQGDWRLGDFEFTGGGAYKFDGDTLLSALETISGTLEDCIWEYSFERYPFVLHVRKLSDVIDSEMRADRNLQSIKYTLDRSRMFTRFYPVGKENLRLSGGGYVSRNEGKYGRIDKTETDQSKATEAELREWGEHMVRRHARPSVTASISGLDLSAGTNEPLDRFTIGHKCRIPMPEIGETVIEKVTKLSWRDKIKDFRSVQITLADALQDVQTIVREEQKKSGGGGRAGAKVDEENKKLIRETSTGLWSMIVQTSTNIMTTVYDSLQGYSTIEQTASAITLAVNGVTSAMTGMYNSIITVTSTNIASTVSNALVGYSTIEQTASQITLAVNGVYSSNTAMYQSLIVMTSTNIAASVYNAASQLRGEIQVQANRISLVVEGTGSNAHVKRAAIIASINNGTSNVTISADSIDIDGLVESLEAKDVMVQHFNAAGGEFTEDLSVLGDLDVAGDTAVQGLTCGALSASSLKVGGTSAGWKSAVLKEPMIGVKHYFMYANSQGGTTAAGTVYAGACLGTTDTTIYYLGHS